MNTWRLGGSLLALAVSAAGCKSMISLNGKPVGGGNSSSSSSPGGGDGDGTSSSASNTSGGGGGTSTPQVTQAAAAPPPPGQAAEWCKDAGQMVSKSDVSWDEFKDIKPEKQDTTYMTAQQFATAFCTTGQVEGRDKILALRAKWMEANGIDDQDFVVLVGMSHNYTYDRQDFDKLGGSLGQVEAFGYSHNAMIQADQVGEAKLSMIARFMLVNSCNHSATSKGLLHDILCTREPLDVKKAFAEIDGLKEINLGTRYQLRKLVRESWDWYSDKKADIEKSAKEDPGIAKVVKIANDTRNEWVNASDKRKELLASVEKMEAATVANKHSAFAGCDKTTKAAWEAHLKGLKLPKVPSKGVVQTFTEATLDTAEGYLAFDALRLCSAGSEDNFYKGSDFIGSDVIRRGPRTATVAAWLAAAGDIKFDDRSLKMHDLFSGVPMTEGSRWEDPQQGVIEKLTPFEGGVEVSFKKVVEPREDCLKYVETNHIVTFENDGTPIYRRNCVKWGMVKMDLTANPFKIGEIMAQGLKPGMYLFGREGLAIVATASSKSSAPIWVFGGSVK